MSRIVKVAGASPFVHIADPKSNATEITKLIEKADGEGANIIAFPELAISGYSCGDLFLQESLIDASFEALEEIIDYTSTKDIIVIVGAPLYEDGCLRNAAFVINKGRVIGRFYKDCLEDNYGLRQSRYFKLSSYDEMISPFDDEPDITLEVKIGNNFISSGADICVVISEGSEVVFGNCNKMFTYKEFSNGRALLVSSCGFGESTTDHLYTGYKAIMQDGNVISAGCGRNKDLIIGEFDLDKTYDKSKKLDFSLNNSFEIVNYRDPFLRDSDKSHDLNKVIDIQSRALLGRLNLINCDKVVIGISGGLDSTLALLVSNIAFELGNIDKKNIIAVSMPCFGTSGKTFGLAKSLIASLGNTYREINIKDSVIQHFKDIDHSPNDTNVAFENAQARERTQVLMDIANDINALVVGTGDMSELALGFCTYGGDQISMYGVNAGVPKTVIRKVVSYIGENIYIELKDILNDILSIPVSPELLPSDDNDFSQKTEDILGPYEVHDFILYYMLRYGLSPENIYERANEVFKDVYDKTLLKNTLRTFYKRFYQSQFKRSCMPDGPKVFDISLSPRDGLFMPSDANCNSILEKIDKLK